uniref:Uncharacterized protein n=1 Tax=Arundo donax TaxID=35708 RepID=A0A0A9AB11_ARUDO
MVAVVHAEEHCGGRSTSCSCRHSSSHYCQLLTSRRSRSHGQISTPLHRTIARAHTTGHRPCTGAPLKMVPPASRTRAMA